MSTHNITFSIYKKIPQAVPDLQFRVFSRGLQFELETAVVDGPSVYSNHCRSTVQ